MQTFACSCIQAVDLQAFLSFVDGTHLFRQESRICYNCWLGNATVQCHVCITLVFASGGNDVRLSCLFCSPYCVSDRSLLAVSGRVCCSVLCFVFPSYFDIFLLIENHVLALKQPQKQTCLIENPKKICFWISSYCFQEGELSSHVGESAVWPSPDLLN